MNKIEEFYKEAKGKELTKEQMKEFKFTYYDMIGFADAYHSKQLNLNSVSGSSLIKVENAYISEAEAVGSYDVTGRVKELWIKESEFDSVKCINN